CLRPENAVRERIERAVDTPGHFGLAGRGVRARAAGAHGPRHGASARMVFLARLFRRARRGLHADWSHRAAAVRSPAWASGVLPDGHAFFAAPGNGPRRGLEPAY